jgi:hypothetical protein
VHLKGRPRGTDEDVTAIVDLIVDQKHRPCPPIGSSEIAPTPGWLGKPRNSPLSGDAWFFPFVIVPSKRVGDAAYIDFGRALGTDRDGSTNLLSKEIRKGEISTFWMIDDGQRNEYIMGVIDVAELLFVQTPSLAAES